ncbi:hypothetical protein LB503_011340 [Fusarium chuoi]|nr:hypothetical protein LB503_011340 [Fusarium chuoi]
MGTGTSEFCALNGVREPCSRMDSPLLGLSLTLWMRLRRRPEKSRPRNKVSPGYHLSHPHLPLRLFGSGKKNTRLVSLPCTAFTSPCISGPYGSGQAPCS